MVKRMVSKKKKQSIEINSQEMYVKPERMRGHRIHGDRLVYYFFHTLLSGVLFLTVAIQFNLLTLKEDSIIYLFSIDYWLLVLFTFIISIVTSGISRFISYFILQGVFWQSATKGFWELNDGINKMSLRWFVALFISAIIWTMGVLAIIQDNLGGDINDIILMILIYIVLKVVIFLATKIFLEKSLIK